MAEAEKLAGAQGVAETADGARLVIPARTRENWPIKPKDNQDVRWLIVLDTETTGIDPTRHSVIELAAARVAIAKDGSVCALQILRTGMRDPGTPLSPTIRSLTGLSDADLKGRNIDPESLVAFLAQANGVIAFNAAFDRPHVENL